MQRVLALRDLVDLSDSPRCFVHSLIEVPSLEILLGSDLPLKVRLVLGRLVELRAFRHLLLVVFKGLRELVESGEGSRDGRVVVDVG